MNIDADSLSRRPQEPFPENPMSQKECERIEQFIQHHLTKAEDSVSATDEVVQAICEKHLVRQSADFGPGIALISSLSLCSDSVPDCYEQEGSSDGSSVLPHLSKDLGDKQRADPVLREVMSHLELGEKPPPTVRKELPGLPYFLKEWNRLELKDGVLYRRRKDKDSITYQLVLPEELRSSVMSSLHDNMGHMGMERTLDLVRARFYWPKMAPDVEQKIRTCGCCVAKEVPTSKSSTFGQHPGHQTITISLHGLSLLGTRQK